MGQQSITDQRSNGGQSSRRVARSDDVLETLRAAVEKVANDAAFQERAVNTATAITYLPADDFGAIWERDWNAFAPMLQGN